MCHVSDQIKFCTCASNIDIEEMDNYWLLHRQDPNKNDMVMGSVNSLIGIDEKDFEINHKMLEKRINESDAFDIPLALQAGDTLHIHITTPKADINAEDNYAFVYQEKWTRCDYDMWSLLGMYDVLKHGSVK